ncbi:hypothetical protein D9619_000207 [Psilocybe cf. subviscida]|uniref:DUF5745 domain-containing protein n=1 Tax=Psilocybe cf. subviscida TaxID=2480587 RepID=A0A8H5BDW1_9AGAR|nr:hypothetical protein D9619_000207 [Psilocybe cf. subviscida]
MPQRRYTLQDEATLVDQLNHLLHALALPISLISPTDLTPRLLIAILESLLGVRLPAPITTTTRRRGSEASDDEQRTARVQSMKIFLGVLETDILQRDVGLSTVDPRRLAEGADEEVFYVAEVLCSISASVDRDRELARARSIPLPHTPSPSPPNSPSPVAAAMPRPRLPLSPKSQLDLDAESLFQSRTTRQSHPRLFSPFLAAADNNSNSPTTSNSLFSSHHHEDEYGRASDDGGYSDSSDTGVSDILGGLPPAPGPLVPSTPPPRRQDDSLLFSAVDNPPIPREQAFSAYHHDSDDHDNESVTRRSRVPVPVRYDGFIAPVDEAQELASFEVSRSMSMSSRSAPSLSGSISTSRGLRLPSGPSLGRARGESVKAQYTRTLELLNERARLLTQLSELKRAAARGHGRGHG